MEAIFYAHGYAHGKPERFKITISTKKYFSITANGRDWFGCNHGIILNARPEFAPIVSLHLSTLDGVPMHASANGLYFVEALLRPELRGEYFFNKENPQCVTKEHFRISDKKLQKLVETLNKMETRDEVAAYIGAFVEKQKPRWKKEADAGLALIAGLALEESR